MGALMVTSGGIGGSAGVSVIEMITAAEAMLDDSAVRYRLNPQDSTSYQRMRVELMLRRASAAGLVVLLGANIFVPTAMLRTQLMLNGDRERDAQLVQEWANRQLRLIR